MALPTKSFATIWSRGRAFFRTSFNGLPMGLKQFLGQTARAVALNVWSLQKSVETLDLDIVPQAQSSAGALGTWAFTTGLPDGQGGYGLLLPTTASGGAATLTGVQGTVYPNGAIATGEDGTTQIALSGSVAIPGTSGLGSVAGSFIAVTTGSVGNLPAGSVCTWQNAPPGADPTFVLTSGLAGAIDIETPAQVFGRLLLRLQSPPRGGNSTDITEWSEAIAGITGVYVYPRRSGTGTVDVVITVGGATSVGTARVPLTSALQTAVQAAIDSVRVPGAEAINVLYATVNAGHIVRVRVTPSGSPNAFDWGADAPGTAYAVDAGGYSAGPPATIRLTGLAPQSLKSAIVNYIAGTGPQPRLQVLSTSGATPINGPVGTSKTVPSADSGGKTTITLDTLPSGWVPPSSGDTIYPYGPVVPTIAAGILALSNSLGPSRQSGYGDPYNTWLDTLSIGQLQRVAEDAVDATGAVLVTQVIDGGATIDGVASSLEASDNTVTTPELLWLSHIAVTQ